MTTMLVIIGCVVFGLRLGSKVSAPVTAGSGACKDCGRFARLYQFASSRFCRACFDRIDGMIP